MCGRERLSSSAQESPARVARVCCAMLVLFSQELQTYFVHGFVLGTESA